MIKMTSYDQWSGVQTLPLPHFLKYIVTFLGSKKISVKKMSENSCPMITPKPAWSRSTKDKDISWHCYYVRVGQI